MEQLVTQAEFARYRGVSRQMVGKWVDAGKIRLHERDGRKLIDRVEADLALGANVARVLAEVDEPADDEAREKAPAPATPGLTAARTEREQYAAQLARLDLEQRLGKLRPVEDFAIATQRCAEIAIRSIDRITGRADELAAQVAKDGVIGARTALRAIARELRTTMAEAFGKLAAGDIRGDDEAEAVDGEE